MPLKSTKLHRAKRLKNDEFYTQYLDIESECSNYLEHFFNKVIYCNCDTADSNFVKYFQNLKSQGLIKDILWSGRVNGPDFRSKLDFLFADKFMFLSIKSNHSKNGCGNRCCARNNVCCYHLFLWKIICIIMSVFNNFFARNTVERKKVILIEFFV